MQDKTTAIKSKVAECILNAEKAFNIKMPKVEIRFDLTGRAAGQAGLRYGELFVRFNTTHMRLGGKTWEHMINDTVAHEIAHSVCQKHPHLGNGHNAGWKHVCVAIGGNGQRTYSEQDAPEAVALQRPYVYTTTYGFEVRVTKGIHSKIQLQGASYTYRDGKGSINKTCKFTKG